MASNAAVFAVLGLAALVLGIVIMPPAPSPLESAAPAPASSREATTPWESLAPLPVARTEAAAVAAAGKIWVIGGIFPEVGGVQPTGRVDVYDPANGTWTSGPALPRPVHHAGVVAAGDIILVTGGFVGGQLNEPQFAAVSESWILNTSAASPSWRPFAPLPSPRGGHAAATDGKTVWVFGGVVGTPIYQGPGALLLAATALKADLEGGRWSSIAPFPDPRDHLAGAFADGKVYAIGGRDLTLEKNTDRVDVYDPATNAWTQAPPMPTARGGLGAAVVGSRIVVAGGENPSSANAEVEVFDPRAASWSAAPPLPEGRHGVGVAALEGAVYVEAGGPRPAFTYSATNYRFFLG